MDSKRRQLLRNNRDAIVKDLDVADIVDNLLSSRTIEYSEYDEIDGKHNRQEKVKKLLEIISRGTNKNYDGFVDSLTKDYKWLCTALQPDSNSIPIEPSNEFYEDILSSGDVPKLPNHYVHRKLLEFELIEKLKRIKRHDVLILHGMPCCGKSSLVNGTLRKNETLIKECFSEKVFWVNVSDCTTEEHIIRLQSRLLRKISPNNALQRSHFLNTSTTLNMSNSVTSLGSLSGSQYYTYDKSLEENRDLLKEAFKIDSYRESLLIIDDLRDQRVADAFAVDCKILMTAQILPDNPNNDVMQVNAELTEDESLRLISFYVKQDISKLPNEAKKLHHYCRGNPLFLSMLGSILEQKRESLEDNPSQWKHYLKQFKTTKNKSNFLIRQLNKSKTNQVDVFTAVEMCINSLGKSDWIEAFKSLVILKDNVKISAKTISIICNMDLYDVDIFIGVLKNKSLITEHYMVDNKSYQYEIHDLVLTYLKKFFYDKEEDLKMLHVQLLKQYSAINCDLINIPNDGYICYHIGYHIHETMNSNELYGLFKVLYRNLEFIGNKIRLTGSTSTLSDLNTYFKYINIESEPENDEFLNKLIKFISCHGLDLYRYPDTDILQSILQHENKGILYTEALKLTQLNHRDHLYLNFQNDSSTQLQPLPLVIDDKVTIVRFWFHYIFVGNESGNITLWSITTFGKLAEYNGHKNPIKSIAISFKQPFKMAATSIDGRLKIWNVDNLVDANDNDCMEIESNASICERIPAVYDLNDKSGVLCDVNWGRNSDILLTHTNPGSKIILYKSDGTILKSQNVSSNITRSILSLDDSLAVVAYELNESHGVYMYCIKTFNTLMTFTEYNPVLMLSIIPDSPKSIFVLTKDYYQVHSWNKILLSDASKVAKNIKNFKQKSNNCEFITASMGNKHPYVFIATSENHIYIYKLKTGERIGELDNYRSPITTMDISTDMDNDNFDNMYYNSYSFLVTASQDDKRSIKIWSLNPAEYSSVTARKTAKFCCIFDANTKNDSSNKNKTDSSVQRSSTMLKEKSKPRKSVQKTSSLDRHSLQLKIGESSFDNGILPLIATVTSSNSIQVYKGKILIAETDINDKIITCITFSHCGTYLIYGFKNGDVVNYTIKNNDNKKIMNINEEVSYLEFLSPTLLMAAGKNRVLMMYEVSHDDSKSNAKMVINSRNELGSQELLDSFAYGRRINLDTNSPSHSGSPISASSSSSMTDISISTYSGKFKKDNYLNKFSSIFKCFLLKNDTFLTISLDGCVKIWDFTPKLLGVLIGKQNIFLSCICLQSNFLALCDDNGNFQVYQLFNSDSEIPIEAELLFSLKIDESIVSCNISYDQKILAMGCKSGHIVLWSIRDKQFMYKIHFHKSPVRCVKFSPTPADFQSSVRYYSGADRSSTPSQLYPPMVLVSLAGQIAWWNVSYIYSTYLKKQRNSRTKNGSILSPISMIVPDNILSMNDMLINEQISVTCSPGFAYPMDTDWEKLWRGKRSKRHYKRDDLIACIKLKGEKALEIATDVNFSTFITIDGGGVLYIMKVVDNTFDIKKVRIDLDAKRKT